MCYLVTERYSLCRCLYYKHTLDTCAAAGQAGHRVYEKTVLVGYRCEEHGASAVRTAEEVKASDGQPSTKASVFDSVSYDNTSSETTDRSAMYDSEFCVKPSDDSAPLDQIRARITNPEGYFESLKSLENDVRHNSSLGCDQRGLKDQYPIIPGDLMAGCRDLPEPLLTISWSDLESSLPSGPLHVLWRCRNTIVGTFLNLKRLQKAGFCGELFSLIQNVASRKNVARLFPIRVKVVIYLARIIEIALRTCVENLTKNPALEIGEVISDHLDALLRSYVFRSLKLVPPVGISAIDVLHHWVQMLDIGVVSYSGAHLNGLNGNEADCDSISFGPASWRGTVKRYKLECLDDFHLGNPVWAFTVPTWEPDRPLYLSTTVETFADIWGPLWKCNVSVTSGRSSYVVGSGVLEPWRHQAIHPPLKGEVFCHWVSNEGYEEAVSTGNALNVHVAVSDQILIGAPKNIQHGLTINLKCTPPISNYRAQFKDLNRLCIMGASRPYSYNDSNQFQLQVGYSGVNMSATKQYKRMPGQSLKKAFAEIWAMMPQLRDPKLLIDLHGVEVSLCTKNSRRVSLGQLLSLGCMRLLLRDFRWDRDQYRDEYFATLLDPARTLSRDDAAFKQNFDQAVMLCLNVLEYSGVDRKENLIVFMASKCTAKPELATLMSSEHSWIKLLRDTTTNCAMAVFGDHCLEFHHNLGVLCGATGRSVLSTALELNGTSQLPMILGLHSITPGWDVTRLEIGKTFWLGEQGTLSVKSHLQDGMLLVEGDRQLFQQPSRC